MPSPVASRALQGEGDPTGARLTTAAAWTPSPQSKSAVADFDRFVEWPKPAYTRFRLGEGWGGGSRRGALKCHISRPPPPTPPHKGEGRSPRQRRAFTSYVVKSGVAGTSLATTPILQR